MNKTLRKALEGLKEDLEDSEEVVLIKKGYVFYKSVFWLALFIIGLFWLILVLKLGVEDQVYFYCPANGQSCENPYFNSVASDCPKNINCNIEYFAPGVEFGAPPQSYKDFSFFVILIVFLSFVVNHAINYFKNKDEEALNNG